MNLFSFGASFTNEESCRLHFKEQRDKQGVVCHRCQGRDHYWLQYFQIFGMAIIGMVMMATILKKRKLL